MRATGKRWVPVVALTLAFAGCGGGGNGEAGVPDGGASEAADDTAEGTPDAASEEAADSTAQATVTVDGTSYDFPDVVECEIDGETWGEGWRKLLAWSADGHNLLDITVGNAESEGLGAISGVDIVIGTQHANTLDEGNPDEEWSTLLGGSVSPNLSPEGASGTAEVAQAGGEGPVTAEWSFSC